MRIGSCHKLTPSPPALTRQELLSALTASGAAVIDVAKAQPRDQMQDDEACAEWASLRSAIGAACAAATSALHAGGANSRVLDSARSALAALDKAREALV
jgi:hypothetical protein